MSDVRPYTPKHLADKILRQKSALEGERKQVTVLFVDVKDSTRLAARVDPETWHKILDRFFARLAEAIHRFEGTVNQYTGDGVMALFGAPIAHEDHAQRACHAALAICVDMREFAAELRRALGLRFGVRVGLNSGEVIVGAIGDDLRMDYTAQGHTVNLAARMQQQAAAGRAYLTAHTAALVDAYFELEAIGKVKLKGVREPVRTFALAGAGSARSRIEVSRARGFSRFVGREREVSVLDRALERALAGDGRALCVTGAPGLGKSRLCHDALERWTGQKVAIAQAHCPAHGRSLALAVLRELLRSFFDLSPGARPAVSRKQVRAQLRFLRSADDGDHALVHSFLGLATPDDPLPALPPAARRDRLFALTCGLVQARSAREPLVLLVDDVQWIDGESELFLARLVDAIGFTRTLLLLNARPEYDAPWLGANHVERLELGPLDARASDSLLRDLVGTSPALAELCSLVTARAAGNPLFAEEIVQALVDQGALARERLGMRLVREVHEIQIPATVQSLLTARVDALSPTAKRALQIAAVVGKRFSEPVLAAVLGEDAAALPEALITLQRADLVHADGEQELAFKHPLTQEVAYGSLLQEAREARHESVARALQALHQDRLGEHADLIAHHWEGAGKRQEGRRWRRLAALRVTNIQLRRPEAHLKDRGKFR
ncbi:MAG TPA: adenylate/guanylate cyclase domain-containing protein [Myxococcota bacterium]|nr:adenylate/guanylate cyclase domain-containing protein [Myxococcota bacterium]